MRRPTAKLAASLLAAGAVACPLSAWAGPVRVGEPSGLGLWGPEVPDVLKQAKADPYAAPVGDVCAAATAELAALNETLGPDANEPPPKTNQAAKLVTRAIRGAIPHKDIIRFVTGAGRKESALQQAVMAGWARRGFLRGLTRNCVDGEETAPVTTTAAGPAVVEAAPLAQAAEAAAIPAADTAPAAPEPSVEATSGAGAVQTVETPEPAAVAVNP
ncbi:hypothetical protein [Phenylobacterium sp.]|jgi:hypothetical protein|uniref:hypothetical protein n=1 Tax=Phenylobacterium sp. TaxID=1871053 RepID=UPI002F942F85